MCERTLISLHNLISCLFSSTSINVTFRKLMTEHSMTSAYQESAGLKLLPEENWENY